MTVILMTKTYLERKLGKARRLSGQVWADARRAVGVVALVFSSFVLMGNGPPATGLEGFGTLVSDDELDGMRGKFVTPDSVSYFGVSMATSWQNADNVTTSAILVFSVDFLGGAGDLSNSASKLAISWSRDCDGCADPEMDVLGFNNGAQGGYVALNAIPIGGLDSVDGAVQSQQIAGNDNGVLNAMEIVVMPVDQVRKLDPEGLQAISQSTSKNFSDGTSLSFLKGANEVGLSMIGVNGIDTVRQGISGDLNQASQHVLLASDFNTIENTMRISIGTAATAQAQRVGLDNAISAMHGN